MMIHTRLRGWITRIVSFSCVLVFAMLAIGITPVQGQTPSDQWTLVGQLGGSTQAVAVAQDIAYVGIGLRLNAIGISDPAQPELLGMSDAFSDAILDIAIYGKTAYVAAGSAGLHIIDISDPTRPTTLGAWSSSGFAEGVAVTGKAVYLADGDQGLRILDVSDPQDAKQIGVAYTGHYVFDVVATGNYAYIAAGDSGLLILDIKDPSQPVELAQLDTFGYAYEVALWGNVIYIADAWEGVQIVDVSNPAKPTQSGTLATNGWSLGVSVRDNRLASANGAMGVDIFDVSDPAQPDFESTYLKEPSEGDAMVRRVVLGGDLILAADTTNGLRLIDVSRSTRPAQRGLYAQLSYARRITLNGDYAYVSTASEGAMYAINIADPLHPYQVSKFQADGIAVDVTINGDYATLGTFMDSTNCYTLIDISDPSNPQFKDAVDLQSLICGAPRQMVAQGNYVYSADEWGLSIYDLSRPGKIETIGRIDLQQEGDQTVALSVSGNYAYVGDASSGLKIVDISDPANPEFILAYNPGDVVGSIFSAGDVLFLGHYASGITTAANPAPGQTPTLLGRYQTLSSVEEATFAEGELVVSEGNGGLEILDASDAAHIQFVQAIETPGFAWASAISGNTLYVADGTSGLLIYRQMPVDQSAENTESPVYPTLVVNSLAKDNNSGGPRFPTGVKKTTNSNVCTVRTNADDGPESLRECLANAVAGETILFDPTVFPPERPVTIALQSLLPGLEVGSVTIDASNVGVILDGQQQVPVGLVTSSSYNTIMGIQFINFSMDGITLDFPGEYNQIGGDHTVGEAPSGQGNVFSGCQNGIRALFTRYNAIKGNFVGTNAAGTQAAQPNSVGIAISSFASHNTIGGSAVGEKNIISNNDRGIDIASNSAVYNVVAGNYIGTDVTGTSPIPNSSWGVLVEVGGRNNIIGGDTPAERNIISGNDMGVCVSDYGATQNSIIGNYIGVDVTGKKALPNHQGVCIFQASYNRVGGTRPGEANVISANSNGVRFFSPGAVHAILMGNIIGLDAEGQSALGNQKALWIDGGTHSMIGGSSEDAGNIFSNNPTAIHIENAGTAYNWLTGNLITNSSQTAIRISQNATSNFIGWNTITDSGQGVVIVQADGNTLHANSISGNAGSGIEFNDAGNLQLPSPLLTQVTGTTVSGTACSFCTVEIFSDPAGQGLIYEGSVSADANGYFSFTSQLTGPNVTATVTDLLGITSGFSRPKSIR
ncbi:MAG: NosD domain-containing protein [Anaerolineales bacterium]